MKCLDPVRMYRADNGIIAHSPNGVNVKSILFRPCGYCINCRLTKAQNWAIRMSHEAQFHEQSSFLTLTYSDDKIPPNGSLRYDDVSNFIKRLRRRLDVTCFKSSLSFYRVGEYGDNFSRPHYHMILFGFNFTEALTYKGVRNIRTEVSSKDDRKYFKSPFLTDCWSHGFADIGEVDFSTCQYVSKYVTKKLFGSQKHLYGDRLPEAASMSKGYRNPRTKVRSSYPLGERWIAKYFRDVYPHDYVVIKGKRFKPPPFYDRWLEANHPSLYLQVKSFREDSMTDSFPDIQSLAATQTIRLQSQSSYLRDGCAPNLLSDEVSLQRKLDFINNDLSKGVL